MFNVSCISTAISVFRYILGCGDCCTATLRVVIATFFRVVGNLKLLKLATFSQRWRLALLASPFFYFF